MKRKYLYHSTANKKTYSSNLSYRFENDKILKIDVFKIDISALMSTKM